MRRSLKILPLLVALLITSALAIPLIQVSVQQLGAGYSEVAPPANKVHVKHEFKVVNGKITLDGVRLKFDKDLPSGTFIRVELRDEDDNVLASGEIKLEKSLSANEWVFIDTDDLCIDEIIKYDRVVVIVADHEVPTLSLIHI